MGAVNQFHYPFARDELHRRTIFVAPKQIAMFSSSVYGRKESMETAMSTDPYSVAARENEFDSIKQRCQASLLIHNSSDLKDLFGCLREFHESFSDSIYKGSCLPTSTLPEEIFENDFFQNSPSGKRISSYLKMRVKSTQKQLNRCRVTDIVPIPPVSDIVYKRIPIPFTNLIADGPYCYSVQDYIAHLKKTIHYLDTYPNYRVIIDDATLYRQTVLYTKRNLKTLIMKKTNPCLVFELIDTEMSGAIFSYLSRLVEKSISENSRETTRTQLYEHLVNLAAANEK